jgi:hypothetical protein
MSVPPLPPPSFPEYSLEKDAFIFSGPPGRCGRRTHRKIVATSAPLPPPNHPCPSLSSRDRQLGRKSYVADTVAVALGDEQGAGLRQRPGKLLDEIG